MAIVKWEPFGEFDRFFNDFPSHCDSVVAHM
jgi:hypothetical protein